ncbi:Uncharacterised protein [Raoultella ornithinolytica]|nr:Uncharacterised protein [Raoultella ornithinolytica]
MALQTWLALLLCLFFLAVSVYSLISYIKDRRKERIPFANRKNAQKIIVAASCHCRRGYERLFFRS